MVALTPLQPTFTKATAAIVAWVSGLCGLGATAGANTSVAFSGAGEVFSYRIVPACTGLTFMLIYTAAVLAYPATHRQRLLGLAIGLLLLFVANIARLVALGWVGLHAPGQFDAGHEYWAQGFLIAITGVLWFGWVWFLVGERQNMTDGVAPARSLAAAAHSTHLRRGVATAGAFAGVFAILGLVGFTLGGVAAWGAIVRAPLVHAAPLFDMTLPPRLPADELIEGYRFHYAGLAAVLALLLVGPRLPWSERLITAIFVGIPLVYLLQVAFGVISLGLFEAPTALAPITTTPEGSPSTSRA